MPHEPDGSAEQWLKFAESDLVIAHARNLEGVLLESLCFHAQQAAEKALKAVLVHFGQRVVRTHSIESLLSAIGNHTKVPPEIEASVRLTAYAVAVRYPGAYEPVSDAEYVELVSIADGVFAWAKAVTAD